MHCQTNRRDKRYRCISTAAARHAVALTATPICPALTPPPRRVMLRATPRGATDGALEPAPVYVRRGLRWARAARGVWAAAGADAAGDSPTGGMARLRSSEQRRGVSPRPA